MNEFRIWMKHNETAIFGHPMDVGEGESHYEETWEIAKEVSSSCWSWFENGN